MARRLSSRTRRPLLVDGSYLRRADSSAWDRAANANRRRSGEGDCHSGGTVAYVSACSSAEAASSENPLTWASFHTSSNPTAGH